VLLSQIRTAAYDFLGTTSTDPAFPAARITRFINVWLNGLYADVNPDALVLDATLTVDAGQERRYTLGTQTPAITNFRTALEVRLQNDSGLRLTERPISQLMALGGPFYAITGADQSAVLVTATAALPRVPVFLRYAYWPAELVGDADTPGALPDRFHHLAALGAAQLAFPAGDEGAFPAEYQALLFDGRAQLLAHLGRRSRDAAVRRER
jgi:hypothetical protein